jgi:Type I restriction modification DNA specificity domain.
MYVDLRDKGISEHLILYRKREFFTTDYIQKVLPENAIVIDIGGNIGYYTLLESQIVSKGHVYSIEPVPGNFSLLKKILN